MTPSKMAMQSRGPSSFRTGPKKDSWTKLDPSTHCRTPLHPESEQVAGIDILRRPGRFSGQINTDAQLYGLIKTLF